MGCEKFIVCPILFLSSSIVRHVVINHYMTVIYNRILFFVMVLGKKEKRLFEK